MSALVPFEDVSNQYLSFHKVLMDTFSYIHCEYDMGCTILVKKKQVNLQVHKFDFLLDFCCLSSAIFLELFGKRSGLLL